MARKNSKTEGFEAVYKEVEEDQVAMHEVTEGKSVYHVYSTDPYNLFKIKNIKGGHVPADLDGMFTSVATAELAIKIYENGKAA